jgi:putative transcriptional regulator
VLEKDDHTREPRGPQGIDAPLPTVLRRLRRQAGKTQEGLAFGSDITIASMSRIERGVCDPHLTTIRSIARALGISLSELGVAVEEEERRRLDPEGQAEEERGRTGA